MSNTFFTADTHFGHANIIDYCDRPFSSVDEMDRAMIDNWNRVVKTVDRVYHLGDFTLLGLAQFKLYVGRLRGFIKIIPGGHDWRWMQAYNNYLNPVYSQSGNLVNLDDPLVSLEYPELSSGRYPQVIVLCHYAMRVWDRSHHGSWHLYGHSHGNLPEVGKSLDVGVDSWNFTPVSLDQVVEKLS